MKSKDKWFLGWWKQHRIWLWSFRIIEYQFLQVLTKTYCTHQTRSIARPVKLPLSRLIKRLWLAMKFMNQSLHLSTWLCTKRIPPRLTRKNLKNCPKMTSIANLTNLKIEKWIQVVTLKWMNLKKIWQNISYYFLWFQCPKIICIWK